MTDIHKHVYGSKTEFNCRAVISSETKPHSNELKYLIQGNALDGVALIHGNLEDIKASFPTYLSVLVKIDRSLFLYSNWIKSRFAYSVSFNNLNDSFTLLPEDDFYYTFIDLNKPITFPYRHKDLSL